MGQDVGIIRGHWGIYVYHRYIRDPRKGLWATLFTHTLNWASGFPRLCASNWIYFICH